MEGDVALLFGVAVLRRGAGCENDGRFPKEMPLKKDGWQFNWQKLSKVEGAMFFKITLKNSPAKVEGLLMLTLINDEMLYMNNRLYSVDG